MNVVYFNAEKFYRLAYDYFNYENNAELAEKYADMALKIDRGHIKAIILKGEIFLYRNNIKEALETFFGAIKTAPDNVFCLLDIAKAYKKEGNYDLALKYLNKIFVNNIKDFELFDEYQTLKTDILSGSKVYKKILHVNF